MTKHTVNAGRWYIQIRGRGIQSLELTQNETKALISIFQKGGLEIQGLSYNDSLPLEVL